MGTDLQGLVEARPDKRWIALTLPIWPSERWGEPKGLDIAPRIVRHYGLYSLLADVRNRNGRRGATWMEAELPDGKKVPVYYDMDDGGHGPIAPIAMPRGVPDDACEQWKDFASDPDGGIHDITWLTLREILDADWDQPYQEDAVLLEEEYREWRINKTMPEHLARDAGGPGLRVVTEEEYLDGERGESSTAIKVIVERGTLRESIPSSWWMTVELMKAVAPDDDPDRVRLLLAFDS